MRRAGERRVGNARELAFKIGRGRIAAEQGPQPGMHARNERDDGSDGAH